MKKELGLAGLCATLAVAACADDDSGSGGSGGSAGTAGSSAGAGASSGSSGSAGSGGSGGSSGSGAGTSGAGGESASGGAGGESAAAGTGGGDAGPDVTGDACADRALTCADIDLDASNYDSGTMTLRLEVNAGPSPIVSGTASADLDCTPPADTIPVSVDTGDILVDFPGDGGASVNILLCAPLTLNLTDACGRAVTVDLEFSYTSEGGLTTMACPTVGDAGSDAPSDAPAG